MVFTVSFDLLCEHSGRDSILLGEAEQRSLWKILLCESFTQLLLPIFVIYDKRLKEEVDYVEVGECDSLNWSLV